MIKGHGSTEVEEGKGQELELVNRIIKKSKLLQVLEDHVTDMLKKL